MSTKKELLEIAKQKGIEVPRNASKEDIEAALVAAGAIAPQDAGDDEDMTAPPPDPAPKKKENPQAIVDALDITKQNITYIEGDKFNAIYFYKNTSKEEQEVRIAGRFYYIKPNEIVGFTLSAVRPMQNYESAGVLYLGFKAK